jgi:hypothetical protein
MLTSVYLRYMSARGISDLLLTIMAAGGISSLDAREHSHAHRAFRALRDQGAAGAQVLSLFGVEGPWKRDPEVGLRVPGLTAAIWSAAAEGDLETHEMTTHARYELSDTAARRGLRVLARLAPSEAAAVYRVGADWARRSTSSKKDARLAMSSAAITRAMLE